MPLPAEIFPELELEDSDEYCEEYCDIDLHAGKSDLLFHPFSYQEGLQESYREMYTEIGQSTDDEEIITLFTFDCYDEKEVFHSLNDLGFNAGYFGIRISDLRKAHFEDVVFSFQS